MFAEKCISLRKLFPSKMENECTPILHQKCFSDFNYPVNDQKWLFGTFPARQYCPFVKNNIKSKFYDLLAVSDDFRSILVTNMNSLTFFLMDEKNSTYQYSSCRS